MRHAEETEGDMVTACPATPERAPRRPWRTPLRLEKGLVGPPVRLVQRPVALMRPPNGPRRPAVPTRPEIPCSAMP
ncbi:hypothetical protein KPB2_5548 [Klebsiella pneumoniae Kb677]|nr:hypothetical protein KPB2_5548 [Klebsiella pneumoniae Kb677]